MERLSKPLDSYAESAQAQVPVHNTPQRCSGSCDMGPYEVRRLDLPDRLVGVVT